MIKKYLKKKFPKSCDRYLRIQEEKLYKHAEHLKKLDKSKYPEELAKIYKKNTGEDLDWNNLRTFNEKMQWAKLYENDPRKTLLADKYLVRDFVKERIGEEYLIPLLGVWNSFDEIDFEKLPDQFVLKTNHGCGTNIIVKDKSKFNKKEAKEKFDRWLRVEFGFLNGFELHYCGIKPKIIAEQYMQNIATQDLEDYKFQCFDGKVYYCWINKGRFTNHCVCTYDKDWVLQDWKFAHARVSDEPIPPPLNADLMVSLAEKLSEGFSQVRVDLYEANGKVYFGEMTVTGGSGFQIIYPKKFDLMLGDLWKLPINQLNND